MLTLAIDTGLKYAGVALVNNNQIINETFIQTNITHSQCLLNLIDFTLIQSQIYRQDLEGLAVTIGPGYYTSLRIGLATTQGLALGLNLLIAEISSLRLLAKACIGYQGIIWAIANASKNFIYVAPFQSNEKKIKRLANDTAMNYTQLTKILHPPAMLVGSGAQTYYRKIYKPGLILSPTWTEITRPGLLGLIGENRLKNGLGIDPTKITPRYCRPSEAEINFGLPTDQYYKY